MAVSCMANLLAFLAVSARASTFLGAQPQVEMQSMPTQELEQLLLSEIASADSDFRLTTVAAELQTMYAALPKNSANKLEPTVVRYALHRYFARKYGWHLRGLEPGGNASNASSPATIMKDRAPSYIMDMLEKRLNGHGLGLKELAVFAVTLTDLVDREAVLDLEAIYTAMGLLSSARVTESTMRSILNTYLMTYLTGTHNLSNSSAGLIEMETKMVDEVIVWFDAKAWVQDVRLAFLHMESSRRNPFVSDFDFGHAVENAQEVGRHFGSFQNIECKALKEKLVDMEHSGSGRVLLSKFYSGVDNMDWPFIESTDYLRTLGALDESDPQRPSVIISNFLSSPSNCESPSGFYSVCCIDECEALLSQVENAVAAPAVSAARLVEVISNLQSGTVAAPRNLSMVQINRLGDIAAHHGGSVPLHGRLFAQWMHHAYPRECRFPHIAGTTNPLTQKEFVNKFGTDVEVSDEELAKHNDNSAMIESVVVELPWMQSEELIASHWQHSGRGPHSTSSPLRMAAVVLAVLSGIVPAFRAKNCLGRVDDKKDRYLV